MLQSFYLSDLEDGGDFKGFSIMTEGVCRFDGAREVIPNNANLKSISSSLRSLGFSVSQIDTHNTNENATNFDGSRADHLITKLPREIELFLLEKQKIDWFIFYYTGFVTDTDLVMPWGATSILQLIQNINDLLVDLPKMFLFECTHCSGPARDYIAESFSGISGGDYLICFSTEYGYSSYHGEVSWWTEHLGKQLVNSCKLNYNMIESLESLKKQFYQTKFNTSPSSKFGAPTYINRLCKMLKFPQFEAVPALDQAIPSPQKYVSIFILCANLGFPEGDPFLIQLVDILYQLGFMVETDLYFVQGEQSLNQWIVSCIHDCDYTMIVGSPTLKSEMIDGHKQPCHDNRTLFFSGSVVYSNLLNPKFTQRLIPVVIHDAYMSLSPEDLFPSPINGNLVYYFKELPISPAHLRFSLLIPDFTKVYCRMRDIQIRPRMKNPLSLVDVYSDYSPRKVINCSIEPRLVSRLDELIGKEIGELACVVSDGLQKSEWKFLARQLGMQESKIDEIEYDWERDGLQEVKVKMLVAWKHQDEEATYGKLCKGLRMIQCNYVVVQVHKFMSSIFN